MNKLTQLRGRYDAIGEELREILDGADEGGLSEEQRTKFDQLKEERANVLETIKRMQDLEGEEKLEDRADPSAGIEKPEVRVGADREADRPFETLGEQLRAVVRASDPDAPVMDKRLLRIAKEERAQGQNQATAAEGGFLIEQDVAQGLVKRMTETGQILSLVNRRPISGGANGMRFYGLKEDSRADGQRHGGVRGYWVAEAKQITSSEMDFEERELRLQKVAAVVHATQEMLDDVAYLETEIADVVPDELRFLVEAAIVAGDGAGKPLGYRNVPAYINVAKESGQTDNTVNAENVSKMWGRMIANFFPNAVWAVDQTVLPQLPLMKIGDMPVWQPDFTASPNGTILGRPIVAHEHGAAVGNVGDIDLVDFGQYRLIDKGGINQAVSMHVRFYYDEMAFRFTYRVDGQPLHRNALTPKSGGDTLSAFVGLAARTS